MGAPHCLGQTRDRLARRLEDAIDPGLSQADFHFDQSSYPDIWHDRLKRQGATYYRALGIAQADASLRQVASARNLSFFGAPHVAFLFIPQVGDNVRVAADAGMYAQTLLLALAARGVATIPQTSLGRFAHIVREELRISPALKLLFGISFGRPDMAHPAHRNRQDRAPVGECVTFHD